MHHINTHGHGAMQKLLRDLGGPALCESAQRYLLAFRFHETPVLHPSKDFINEMVVPLSLKWSVQSCGNACM